MCHISKYVIKTSRLLAKSKVFSCEHWKISRKELFYRTPLVVASVKAVNLRGSIFVGTNFDVSNLCKQSITAFDKATNVYSNRLVFESTDGLLFVTYLECQ